MLHRKELYGILMVSALLMASCSEVDEAEIYSGSVQVPIAFDCTIGDDATTRAVNGYTGNITQENNQLRYTGFGVFACHQAGNTPDLMYNQQVTFTFLSNNTGNGYWSYSPLKYWPNSNVDKVCFYAYAPYVPTTFTAAADATGIIGISSNTVTTPYILYARAKHPEEHVDLLWAAYTPGEIKPVRFAAGHSLHHALARIKVSLGITNGASLPAGSKLLVKRVTFTGNFAKTGKLNLAGTGTTPTWYDQVLAAPSTDPDADKTIFIDHDPEVNTASYGIIAEVARYIDGLPVAWQPAGLPHVNYAAADASTKVNLLCMGDAVSYLYLIPQSPLSLSCVLDYCIITSEGVKTEYHKTLNDGSSITIASLNGNTTYDLTLTITI